MIFLKNDNVENYAYYYDIFSKEECDEIIRIGKSKKLQKAGFAQADLDVDPTYRISDICWLDNMDIPLVYNKLVPLVNEANSKYFNFDLYGFTEHFQFTEYKSPDGNYKFHMDKVYNFSARKLSMVIQLTGESEYTGGDLQLLLGEAEDSMSRKRGSVFFFPSYVLHRVTPVTSGTRHSLVTWLGGPPFK